MVRQSKKTPKTPAPPPAETISTTVALSEVLSAGLRLEASAFSVRSRNAIAALRTAGYPLQALYGDSGLCREAHNAFRFRRIWVNADRGVPFLSGVDIIYMRPVAEHFISRRLTPRLDELMIAKGDVLISCSGTIGNVSLASGTMVGSALSQDVIRLRAADADTAGYVTAFLRSRYGRPQLEQLTYGSVIAHIEPEHLTHIVIPELPPIRRIAVGRLMCEASDLRDQANDLLAEADRLLHDTLRLPPIEEGSSGPVTSSVRASDLRRRLDASFHAPVAIQAEKNVAALAGELATLGDERVTKEIRPITKFRKRVYVQRGGIPLVSTRQLFQIDPIDVHALAKGAHTKDLPEISLKHNMICITRSGTIGRVQIIPKYMAGWAASEHATRAIAAPGMNAGYLYAWLVSDYGKCLLTRHSYGSVILEIDRDMIASVPIPLPGQDVQDQIGNLVLRANDLRDQAWRKEREAIGQLEVIFGDVQTSLKF